MISALIAACVEELRERLSFDVRPYIGQSSGYANLPDRFLLVSPVSWSPGDAQNEGHHVLDETYSIMVVAGARARDVPVDQRIEALVYDQVMGLETMARECIKTLHLSVRVMHRANKLLSAISPAGAYQFIEPLRWVRSDAGARFMSPSWLVSDEPAIELQDAVAVIESVFGGARRTAAMFDVQELLNEQYI